MDILPDELINILTKEKKVLPNALAKKLFEKWKEKPGHKESDISLLRNNGDIYHILMRQNTLDHLDFTIILVYEVVNSNKRYILLRCNGLHGEHTNKIEKEKFFSCHIHKATERYQKRGSKIESYAVPTKEYETIYEAWEIFVKEANLVLEQETPSLF